MAFKKSNAKITIFYLVIAMMTVVSSSVTSQTLQENDLQNFCEDKPIWAAFGISSKACMKAASDCAAKAEFADLDPVQLSEPFYACVFEKVGIEID